MRWSKKHIMTIAIDICMCINMLANNIQETSVTYEKYLLLRDKYAEVIVPNNSMGLSNYIGDLGEVHADLNAFFVKREDGFFYLLIEQFADNKSKSYWVDLYPETISDTIYMYVYPIAYPWEFSLYIEHDRKSSYKKFSIEFVRRFRVIDVYETWLLVNFIYQNSVYQGWLPDTEYCSAIYTTCN